MDFLLNDNFGKPCLLIFKFGWSKFYPDRKAYMGKSSTGFNFPGKLRLFQMQNSIAVFVIRFVRNTNNVFRSSY